MIIILWYVRFRYLDAQTLENMQWKVPTDEYVRMVNGLDNVQFALVLTKKTIMHVCYINYKYLFIIYMSLLLYFGSISILLPFIIHFLQFAFYKF